MRTPRKVAPSQSKAALRVSRLNLSSLALLAMIVLGVVTLAPRVQTWFTQRQAIFVAQQSLEDAKKEVAQMQVERKRWEDPAYIRAQARDRLYYVMPGEVSYLVMDADGVNTSDTSGTVGAKMAADKNNAQISSTIYQTKNNWVDAILESVIRAGVEQPTDSNIVAETQTGASTKAGN
jgi:cell division protein FtsB